MDNGNNTRDTLIKAKDPHKMTQFTITMIKRIMAIFPTQNIVVYNQNESEYKMDDDHNPYENKTIMAMNQHNIMAKCHAKINN